MASLSTDGTGNRRILFIAADGSRKTIRLGKLNKRLAEGIKARVEVLAAALQTGQPADSETLRWCGTVGDDIAGKLAAVGLIPERKSESLATFLASYLARRRADAKAGTVTNLVTVSRDVANFFGPACSLRDITETRADDFRTHYLTRLPKLAPATVARRLNTVKQFFAHAQKLKIISSNPFADITAPGSAGAENRHYVNLEDTQRLLDKCDPAWRVMVALSRFAGLRCPSEVLLLRWENVDLPAGRMTVSSPKTEHHPGKAYRVVPIFPGLRPFIEAAWDLARPGAEFVASGPLADRSREKSKGKQGWTGVSLATRLAKLIRRAGLTVWPRPFHNMRASCETDLVQNHPIHVVCAWLGNTPAVAIRHYLSVREEDFQKAISGGADSGALVTQKPSQPPHATECQAGTKNPQPLAGLRVRPELATVGSSWRDVLVGDTGFEPVTSSV